MTVQTVATPRSATAQIARAAGVVMVFFLLSRVLGLVRDVAITSRFGTSAQLDAYQAAYRLPDILFNLIAGGALASAFIPTFTGFLTRRDLKGAWRLASAVVNLIVIAMTTLAILGFIFARPLVEYVVAPGFQPAQQDLTISLTRWMLFSAVIFGVSGLFMGILNAHQHFVAPSAAPLAYNLGIIAGAWFLAPHYGVYGLVIGVICGALGHLLIQIPAVLVRKPQYAWVLDLHDPGVRQVLRLMGPRILGLAAIQLNLLVNVNLASGLGAGAIVALNLAFQLMLLPQGAIAQSIASAAFPTFAAQVARGDHEEMRTTLSRALRTILFLTIPATIGLIVLRVPLITLLYRRGNFTQESVLLVAYALQFYALGLCAHSVIELAARAFYALHDTRTPVIIGLGAVALNLAISLVLIGPLNYGGLALANTLATTLEMGLLTLLLSRRIGGIQGRQVLAAIARSALASALMAGGLVALLASRLGQQPGLVIVLVTLPVGAIIYLGVSLLLRAEEPSTVMALLRRRR